MEAIIFSLLSAAACAFLIYVFANFHREIVHLEKKSAGESHLTYIGSRVPEPALPRVRHSFHVGQGQQKKIEALMRKEILIAGIAGVFGLLAPFILLMLLHSSSVLHN